MKKYIVNITSHLIGKNRYDIVFSRIKDPKEFVKHIKLDLAHGDIRVVSPAKLGVIMCLFEVGDVMASSSELFGQVDFNGNCEDALRELVSLCLAFAIRDRLSTENIPGIPKWEGQLPFLVCLKNAMDYRAATQ